MKKIVILLVGLFMLASCQKDEQQITYVVDIDGAGEHHVEMLINGAIINYDGGGVIHLDKTFNCDESEPLRLLVLVEQSDYCEAKILIDGEVYKQDNSTNDSINILIIR